MHHAAALILAIHWQTLYTSAPVRIVALSSTITVGLQAAKRFIPLLSGWKAVAANLFFSLAGVLAFIKPADFWTADTLDTVTKTVATVIVASIGAAGIHGTAKNLLPPPAGEKGEPQSNTVGGPAPSAASKTPILVALLAIGMLGLSGCAAISFERITFQSLSASQATINQFQNDYEARTIPRSTATYTAINKAKAAQTLAVDAMVAYEELKASGAAASALTSQQNIVTALIANIPPVITAIQAFYQKTSGVEYRYQVLPGRNGLCTANAGTFSTCNALLMKGTLAQ